MYIQNLSKHPKRVKILQPKTINFKVDYDAGGQIAAGLSKKIVIVFETTELADFSDEFKVLY